MNCVWSIVVLSTGFLLLSFLMASLKLAELISVSPHVTDSRIASWRKTYCSCITHQDNQQQFELLYKTHRSLYHLHALVPHLVDGSCNVHHLLLLDLLQHIVHADEGASTTNTSTVRYHNMQP